MKADYDIDVLVVGYGAAGANAAIVAHDAGARVLIVEKQAKGGGNSAVCAGSMAIPQTLGDAMAYYRKLSYGTVGEDELCAFARAMVDVPDLLSRLGISLKARLSIPAAFPSMLDNRLKLFYINPTGENGFRLLEEHVKKRNIKTLTDTQIKTLIKSVNTNEILGAKALYQGQDITILARKAVVLACGGYASSSTMLSNFNVSGISDYVFSWGSPGNTGDGIGLASEAGAALWHMAAVEWGRFCARAPSEKFGTAIGYGLGRTHCAGSYVFANKSGKRFMAEDALLSHCKSQLDILQYDHGSADYINLPAYMVFDQAHASRGSVAPTAEMIRKKRGGVAGYSLVHSIYNWSVDNQAEIDQGWVIKADTIGSNSR